MKKLSKFVLGAIAIGILSFNLALNDGKSISNTTLKNISAMQASAYGEVFCDKQTEAFCEYTIVSPTGSEQLYFGIGILCVMSED